MSNVFEIIDREAAPASGRRKVIITCAVTGAVHTPSMSEYLPVTPVQIAEQAIEAARAGAAILHLHARNPDGSPTTNPAVYDEFVPTIAAETDATINITTGGATRMTLNERLAYPLRAKPELCSINMGTMNFAFHKAARGVVGWKHPWEKPYVEGSEDRVSRNTFGDIRTILAELGDQHGVRFAFECYDVGQLHNLAHCVEEGLVKGPLFIQCALGILGGLGPEPESLLVMRSTADRLFGRRNYEFSVLGVRTASDIAGRDGRDHGGSRSGRARGQPVPQPGIARDLMRRTGAQDPADPGGAFARHRKPRRGPEQFFGRRAPTR